MPVLLISWYSGAIYGKIVSKWNNASSGIFVKTQAIMTLRGVGTHYAI